jgi:transcriptional regulator with XRE-family HTH domain
MNIREMRKQLGDTQSEFALRYNIPFRTIQNWEAGTRKPPEYIINLLEHNVEEDLINRKTIALPKYDSQKIDLPKRSDFIGATAWLKAIQEFIDEPIIFALDEALMCQGSFLGRSDEYIVWVYGSDTLNKYNGIVVLSNQINKYDTESKNGLVYTNFNRTVYDALANKSILDMQGITEALNKYYVSNDDSFGGLFVIPKYQKQFGELANTAINYYKN